MTFSSRAIEAALDAFNGCKSSNDIDAMQDALSAALAVDGLALVPAEPTEAMFAACGESKPENAKNERQRIIATKLRDEGRAMRRADYRAMLAAASDDPAPQKKR